MGISYNPAIVTSGLVLCLDAANPKSYPGSGTTWTDLSGRGNNGTLVNGVGYNSSNLGSLSFDGVNDYSNLPSISSTNDGFSIALWINSSRWALPSCPCPNTSGIIDWSTGFWNYVSIFSNTSGPFFVIYNQSTSPVGVSLSFNAPSLNTWYYLVATFGPSGVGNFLRTYRNGILQNSGSLSGQGGVFTITASPSLGAYNRHCGMCYQQANIPQVSIYNRALTASEIQQNFNATKSRFL
jgi:hypothetical protein